MKTTIRIRDDLLRRLKARAALRGQSMREFMEERLEKALLEDEAVGVTTKDFLAGLPEVPREAVEALEQELKHGGFREIEPEMWR